MRYCTYCGAEIHDEAVICVKCGCSQEQKKEFDPNKSSKDGLTALLLCLFLGYLGIHRFYTGHTTIGVVQLLTMGGCGIWALIDLIMIITGGFKDIEGKTVSLK